VKFRVSRAAGVWYKRSAEVKSFAAQVRGEREGEWNKRTDRVVVRDNRTIL